MRVDKGQYHVAWGPLGVSSSPPPEGALSQVLPTTSKHSAVTLGRASHPNSLGGERNKLTFSCAQMRAWTNV